MNTTELLFDLLKIILPSGLLLLGMYFLIKTYVDRDYKLRLLELRMKNSESVLPIRLQAYERMTLFLERITPSNLLIRVSGSGQTASDYHRMLINDIRNEYNHNLSQQIYMTDLTWEKIQSAKENVVTLINRSYHEMQDKSKGTDLAKRVLETIIAQETDPTAHAITIMKKEINQVF
jgi:N-acyl-D-aspartate/D-glutamate deacylase